MVGRIKEVNYNGKKNNYKRERACEIVLKLMEAQRGAAMLELNSIGVQIKSKPDIEILTRHTINELSWFIGARDVFSSLFGNSAENIAVIAKTNQHVKYITEYAQELVKEKMKEFGVVKDGE